MIQPTIIVSKPLGGYLAVYISGRTSEGRVTPRLIGQLWAHCHPEAVCYLAALSASCPSMSPVRISYPRAAALHQRWGCSPMGLPIFTPKNRIFPFKKKITFAGGERMRSWAYQEKIHRIECYIQLKESRWVVRCHPITRILALNASVGLKNL